eukprot:TRINITY_DN40813_c0_g1_i1.p1 TRINITY_DN40813_c0_g1~~TRINITY_DN40813_c0_g1_i1.p1  ORF type:complete len:347 (-),score=40.12 TRINITY_DN40813_c0_g1_i1:18-1058(-)
MHSVDDVLDRLDAAGTARQALEIVVNDYNRWLPLVLANDQLLQRPTVGILPPTQTGPGLHGFESSPAQRVSSTARLSAIVETSSRRLSTRSELPVYEDDSSSLGSDAPAAIGPPAAAPVVTFRDLLVSDSVVESTGAMQAIRRRTTHSATFYSILLQRMADPLSTARLDVSNPQDLLDDSQDDDAVQVSQALAKLQLTLSLPKNSVLHPLDEIREIPAYDLPAELRPPVSVLHRSRPSTGLGTISSPVYTSRIASAPPLRKPVSVPNPPTEGAPNRSAVSVLERRHVARKPALAQEAKRASVKRNPALEQLQQLLGSLAYPLAPLETHTKKRRTTKIPPVQSVDLG